MLHPTHGGRSWLNIYSDPSFGIMMGGAESEWESPEPDS